MHLKDIYWYYPDIVPKRHCDYIVKHATENFEEKIGATQWDDDKLKERIQKGDKKAVAKQQKIRKSSVKFFDDEWVYRLIRGPINAANVRAEWNFDFTWFQSCQFTIYKTQGYYNWHRDTNPETSKTMIRKISASLLLSEPDEYEGGDFEFKLQNMKGNACIRKVTETLHKGSMIVFPSHLFHRVKPVLKGIRHSLVIWGCGPYFK